MQKEVRDVLRPFKDMWTGELGSVKVTHHLIKLKPDSKPVFSQPYRAGAKAREVEEQEVNKMLDADVIERAKTEWASPVVLVPKPDGSLRFCVEYRELNALTVRDSYPVPRMDKCLDSVEYKTPGAGWDGGCKAPPGNRSLSITRRPVPQRHK